MSNGLENKRVLVTAGASGIGAAAAAMFKASGCKVHICDVNEAAVTEFLANNPGISGSVTDVSNESAVQSLFETVSAELGGLDILINNAGIAGPTAFVDEMDFGEWQQCLDVNLNGAFLCARSAIPMLKDSKNGSIINMSSTAGLFGMEGRAPYVSAKWAIIGFTKTLAIELGGDGINCNAICPGCVEGDRIDRVIAAQAANSAMSEADVRASYVEACSMKAFITADEIASLMVYLCSDIGANISGQAIPVDGHAESIS
jgi:NAD(P)-dependent dehydrogenase (short-subunit alcohol dehydrogenase family)